MLERLRLTPLWNLISQHRLQFFVFLILGATILILTVVARSADNSVFQRFFGGFNPILIVSIVVLLGLLLCAFFLYTSNFEIVRQAIRIGPLSALALAIPFAALMILVDRYSPFPKDINIAFPNSLAFYPVMAFVVEIIFHLLPLALLFFLIRRIGAPANPERVIWILFLIVALIEPIFQVILGREHNAPLIVAFLGLFLLVFNYVQLLLFRRYDFISMYLFRISYYVIWHIVWGHFRIRALF